MAPAHPWILHCRSTFQFDSASDRCRNIQYLKERGLTFAQSEEVLARLAEVSPEQAHSWMVQSQAWD